MCAESRQKTHAPEHQSEAWGSAGPSVLGTPDNWTIQRSIPKVKSVSSGWSRHPGVSVLMVGAAWKDTLGQGMGILVQSHASEGGPLRINRPGQATQPVSSPATNLQGRYSPSIRAVSPNRNGRETLAALPVTACWPSCGLTVNPAWTGGHRRQHSEVSKPTGFIPAMAASPCGSLTDDVGQSHNGPPPWPMGNGRSVMSFLNRQRVEQEPYSDRNETLRLLGFPSYRAYQRRKLWEIVRERALVIHGRICRKCGRPASQVHHASYLREVLIGEDIRALVPICAFCHKNASVTPRHSNARRATALRVRHLHDTNNKLRKYRPRNPKDRGPHWCGCGQMRKRTHKVCGRCEKAGAS